MIRLRGARPVAGLNLLFLATVACAERGPKEEGETNDTAPPDTGADTAPDSETGADTDTGAVDRCASSESWTHVTAGAGTTCGVHADGCVECWGAFPDTGQTDEYNEWSPWPAADVPFETVDLSWDVEDHFYNSQHACGIRADTGEVVCWGWNPQHSLDAPTGAWSRVAVAADYACAIEQDVGLLACWGDITGANLRISAERVYTSVDLYFTDLVALGLDGVLYSLNSYSLEDVGSARGPYTNFSVSADGYVYAVRHDGGVDVWVPQLDRGNPDNHPRVADPLVPDPIYTCATREQFCVLGASGEVLCLRDGGTSPPTADFVQLTCGEYHACGLTSDGSIECWGSCRGSSDPCDVPS